MGSLHTRQPTLARIRRVSCFSIFHPPHPLPAVLGLFWAVGGVHVLYQVCINCRFNVFVESCFQRYSSRRWGLHIHEHVSRSNCSVECCYLEGYGCLPCILSRFSDRGGNSTFFLANDRGRNSSFFWRTIEEGTVPFLGER